MNEPKINKKLNNKHNKSMEQQKIEQPKIETKEKEELKKYNNIKFFLESKTTEEMKYPDNRAKTLGVSIGAFERAYPDELVRLKRIAELGRVYKEEFLKQKEVNPEKTDSYWAAKTMAQISKSILAENEKQELKKSQEAEKSRILKAKEIGGMIALVPDINYSLGLLLEGVGKLNLEEIEKSTKEKLKTATQEEKPKMETEEQRSKHEIELEQRPEPQKGEALDLWIKRIGGPNAETVESLSDYKMPDKKKDTPLLIDKDGNFMLNNENLGEYVKKDLIDALLKAKNPNVKFIQDSGEYEINKALFKNPETYFKIIGKEFESGKKIVVDKKFGESIEKWKEELGEKPEEKKAEEKKPEKKARKKPAFAKATVGKEEKPEPEKEKKPLTPDEQIEQKRKELEDVEQKYYIYYSPVVHDLLGLYYESRLKDVRKELKELEKGRGKQPKKEKVPEPTVKDYLNHIKETDKLFTDMALVRGKVKRKELKPEEYKKAKAKWQEAFKKTLDMENGFDAEILDHIIAMGTRARRKAKEGGPFKRALEKIKKIAKALWNLVVKTIGKEIINEVKKDVVKLDLKEVKARLAAIRMGVKQGMGQAPLEKEKIRLEKRLKELQGKKAKKKKAKKNKK